MSVGIDDLKERISRGEFRFGDTLRLKHLQKVEACKEAKKLVKKAGVSDNTKLYAYVVSLEKRLEALEELLQLLLSR
jgi:hypothetical protein